MGNGSPASGSRAPVAIRVGAPRVLLTGLLGVAAAILVSCGSAGRGLIPSANAGPLQGDFETVAQEAQRGDGSCGATEAALRKTERDFNALPATIDAGLRARLREGISKLRSDALELCSQALPQSTATSTSPPTTSTQTTAPTLTQTTTPTTPATSTPTSTGPGGGTPAGEGEGEVPAESEHGDGKEQGGSGGAEPPGQAEGK